jgi:hypothetical protein
MSDEEALPPLIGVSQCTSGQSPQDMDSQAEPGNQRKIRHGPDKAQVRGTHLIELSF